MATRHDPDSDRRHEGTGVESTRVSRAWLAAFVGLVTLLVAVIFIAQNGDDVAVEFLAWEGTISLGLALLLAAVLGGLIVFSLGAARMVQLRRAFRRRDEQRDAESPRPPTGDDEAATEGPAAADLETERERTR